MADDPRADPDVDLRVPGDRGEVSARPVAVLAVIAVGGVLGACVRAGAQAVAPRHPGGFPWATFAVNVLGCLLIGAVMVLAVRVWSARPLLRPFLGVGVLGGFTTFSGYLVDTRQALAAGAVATAWSYLGGTLVAALSAVWVGGTATGWLLDRWGAGGPGR